MYGESPKQRTMDKFSVNNAGTFAFERATPPLCRLSHCAHDGNESEGHHDYPLHHFPPPSSRFPFTIPLLYFYRVCNIRDSGIRETPGDSGKGKRDALAIRTFARSCGKKGNFASQQSLRNFLLPRFRVATSHSES